MKLENLTIKKLEKILTNTFGNESVKWKMSLEGKSVSVSISSDEEIIAVAGDVVSLNISNPQTTLEVPIE